MEAYRPFVDFQHWIRRAANAQNLYVPRGDAIPAESLAIMFRDEINEKIKRQIQKEKLKIQRKTIKEYRKREKILVTAITDIGEELEERGITLEPDAPVSTPASETVHDKVPSDTTMHAPGSPPATPGEPVKKNWVLPASILALFLLG